MGFISALRDAHWGSFGLVQDVVPALGPGGALFEHFGVEKNLAIGIFDRVHHFSGVEKIGHFLSGAFPNISNGQASRENFDQ